MPTPKPRRKPVIMMGAVPDDAPPITPGVYFSSDYFDTVVQQLMQRDKMNLIPVPDDSSEDDSEDWVTDEEEEVNEEVEACLKELNQ